jgi:hypothetical protein
MLTSSSIGARVSRVSRRVESAPRCDSRRSPRTRPPSTHPLPPSHLLQTCPRRTRRRRRSRRMHSMQSHSRRQSRVTRRARRRCTAHECTVGTNRRHGDMRRRDTTAFKRTHMQTCAHCIQVRHVLGTDALAAALRLRPRVLRSLARDYALGPPMQTSRCPRRARSQS